MNHLITSYIIHLRKLLHVLLHIIYNINVNVILHFCQQHENLNKHLNMSAIKRVKLDDDMQQSMCIMLRMVIDFRYTFIAVYL